MAFYLSSPVCAINDMECKIRLMLNLTLIVVIVVLSQWKHYSSHDRTDN